MEKDYSVAIYPSEAIISLVKSMKEQLAKEVGWFHSKNSVGHITICEFKATDTEIEIIKNQLDRLCDTLQPVEVTLNGFGSYPNGAFFISPNAVSKNSLKPIMKRIQESLRVRNMKKNDDPHLSIARRLTPENLERAKALFTTIDVDFLCDSIVLRKFDENIKQFVVIDTFKFNNNPQPELIQGTLF
ncbi:MULTISPECIES: 2'-5' RNA ligase family protein [Flavobacterium]|uniref:2'-5' RNA ligase family protein n=1 Tax=Flavobacterium gawalongense TaxID=2594432 RepID=A0A553BPJ6_9FLAO|nr:2'-5' RNA ligase family protein [Flavobacterium gawalongense]TRX01574.1 2'-5' RNA ligase family protein [Flavobacterium gawalongense]TRX06075.1 2'-5' RNA ligase family protein [Flavobacterium gawalongense]TRX10170.1 2'-5' RNA ligase family protein [Flavobacterium gawalongense]TRX11183.1 2'-5' RNA ligase family protein [Flavobacterium gawalongense]TRX28832.1 2'-5' RNA ligase family protein [Flavobacterium gawalongense]